jgi:alkylation response protein AidB-like acyl-CoA dehydrogenase
MGMRGTGSHDVVANDVFIPAHRATALRPFSMDRHPAFDRPYMNLGFMPLVLGNAIVALGIARAAIDESIDLVRTKTPAHLQTPPGQRSTVHAHLGRAEATLSAARSYFYDSLAKAWEAAQQGPIGVEERKHLQLAASYAAESAAAAVDCIHASIGGNGVLEGNHAFGRHFRDVHTITQHALCSPARFESIGQIMLGMETDWVMFNV